MHPLLACLYSVHVCARTHTHTCTHMHARRHAHTHTYTHVSDERGLDDSQISIYNNELLEYLLDDLMPWHRQEGIKRFWFTGYISMILELLQGQGDSAERHE